MHPPAMNDARQATLVAALKDPCRYPHPVDHVEVVETHISHVLLAGEFAYKIKKPVKLGFLDFSSIDKRLHFCREEIRLNRRLAPGLYLEVVTIGGTPAAPQLGSEGKAIEYAVKMRRFPQESLLDDRLAAGLVDPDLVDTLAETVAAFHEGAARADPKGEFGTAPAVWNPVADCLAQLGENLKSGLFASQLAGIGAWSRTVWHHLAPLVSERLGQGHVRECHGDLHLGNVALVDGRPCIFDCIEFNPGLRWIDVFSEIAFLTMDLAERGRPDYGYRFLNRYLEAGGDYSGLPLLPFYQAYRALVRANVASIRARQKSPLTRAPDWETCGRYLEYARCRATTPSRFLLLMHGPSGSGKTWLSGNLMEQLGAIRIRSDVERKRLQGLPPLAPSPLDQRSVIYGPRATDVAYDRLVSLSERILAAGYPVIIDATALLHRQREVFRNLAARARVPFMIIACEASPAILRERIARRRTAGRDASEADEAVLARQLVMRETIGRDEAGCCLKVDATAPLSTDLMLQLAARGLAARP